MTKSLFNGILGEAIFLFKIKFVRKIIKLLLNVAWFVLQCLLVIKSLTGATFKLIAKPGRVMLRFFYYSLILPAYRVYLLIIKKLGLSKSKQDKQLEAILINKKLIHFIFVGLIFIMAYANLFKVQNKASSEEVVGKTLLAKIVADEFVQVEHLIEVYQDPKALLKKPIEDYWTSAARLRPPLALDYTDDWSSVGEVAEQPTRPGAPARSGIIEYTVRPGDSVSGIAQYFGLSVNTVLWENNLSAKSYIKPGDKLKILPVSGVSHTVVRGDNLAAIAKKYGVATADILRANDLVNVNQIRIGEKLIIPGGSKVVERTAVATTRSPLSLADIITGQREAATPVSGSKMNWPVQGAITQYYSWRHNGLDIANKTGTPIYAAEGGTVTEASWNSGGYGYYIIVDHGGGRKTLYAHLSKFACRVGDVVSKGQNIGFVGSTGRSTGPHLHFEVIISGKRYNPLSYLY